MLAEDKSDKEEELRISWWIKIETERWRFSKWGNRSNRLKFKIWGTSHFLVQELNRLQEASNCKLLLRGMMHSFERNRCHLINADGELSRRNKVGSLGNLKSTRSQNKFEEQLETFSCGNLKRTIRLTRERSSKRLQREKRCGPLLWPPRRLVIWPTETQVFRSRTGSLPRGWNQRGKYSQGKELSRLRESPGKLLRSTTDTRVKTRGFQCMTDSIAWARMEVLQKQNGVSCPVDMNRPLICLLSQKEKERRARREERRLSKMRIFKYILPSWHRRRCIMSL